MKLKLNKEGTIAIIFVVVFAIILLGLKYSLPIKEEDYVKKNSNILDLSNYENNSDLKLIKNDIEDKKIIITGGQYNIKQSNDIQEKFLTYLIDNWDLKYFLIEDGYAQTAILNEYLQTGDEKFLDEYYNMERQFSYLSTLKRDMFKNLYLKNKELSEKNKIQVIGIVPVEVKEKVNVYFNILIEKHKELSEEQIITINKFLKDIEEINIYYDLQNTEEAKNNTEKLLAVIEGFENDINKDLKAYKKALGDDFYGINHVISNIKNLQYIPKVSGDGDEEYFRTIENLASKLMYENFAKIYKEYGKEKFYIHSIQGGNYQREVYGIKSIGSLMNEDKNYKDKVYSFNTIYGGDPIKLENGAYTNISNAREELKKLLKDTALNEGDVIIRLDNGRSPYKKKFELKYFQNNDALVDDKYFKENPGMTTDYFKGVIIINQPSMSEEWYKMMNNMNNSGN
ncbi:MAG: hypothetical protein RR636_14180 [Clostridium sp.]|uniref:hypothetical protein n=2 Tax=Clostridium sp. TaxID=1506 RepID=UPI00321802FD